ncbi:MAG: hypothetical protein O7C75_13340, partial [Verrucomicrobia bacterium]|nr:hypothetical protein [Verrucomicrobiota bacterium]
MNGLSRTVCIFGVFMLGAIFPYMVSFDFLIKYMVMVMLFLAYISMPITGNPIRRTHIWILLANLSLGFIPYLILKPFLDDYALTAFMSGIA